MVMQISHVMSITGNCKIWDSAKGSCCELQLWMKQFQLEAWTSDFKYAYHVLLAWNCGWMDSFPSPTFPTWNDIWSKQSNVLPSLAKSYPPSNLSDFAPKAKPIKVKKKCHCSHGALLVGIRSKYISSCGMKGPSHKAYFERPFERKK